MQKVLGPDPLEHLDHRVPLAGDLIPDARVAPLNTTGLTSRSYTASTDELHKTKTAPPTTRNKTNDAK